MHISRGLIFFAEKPLPFQYVVSLVHYSHRVKDNSVV